VNERLILRNLAFALAALLFVATVLQLLDQLNILVQPPTIPDSANLVERVTAQIPYRQSVWPLFALENGLLGAGFLVLIGLAVVLASRARDGSRGRVVLWTLATAGIIGAIAQLVLIGAVKASIEIPYCDCGFKNEEIVSQVWAEMVSGSAVQVLIYGASIMAAVGLAVAARTYTPAQMPSSWAALSYVAAAFLIVDVVLGYAGLGGDATTWFTAFVVGIVIPAWAIWLALRFDQDRAAS
jgi:hypothetical protein